jgi:hypothetical protein
MGLPRMINELNRGYPLRRADRPKQPGTTKGATNRLTAPACWKFESISLQEGVRCEPDLLDHGYIPDVLGGIEPTGTGRRMRP